MDQAVTIPQQSPIELGWHAGTPDQEYPDAFRAYHPSLKDEDFNPSGTVEAYWTYDEAGHPIVVGAVWDPVQDQWMAKEIEVSAWQSISGPFDANEAEHQLLAKVMAYETVLRAMTNKNKRFPVKTMMNMATKALKAFDALSGQPQ